MREEPQRQIFVNCPFDVGFKPLFDAIIFAVIACGFRVRSALEVADSGEPRLVKIYRLIGDCSHSIHDLSRVELDGDSGLPRFNMPIELGIALGFRQFARRKTRHKLLVLDSQRYRYQAFASDLAGLDIMAHGDRAERAIGCVRGFLESDMKALPTADHLSALYSAFETYLPTMAAAQRQSLDQLSFVDRVWHAEKFIEQTSSP